MKEEWPEEYVKQMRRAYLAEKQQLEAEQDMEPHKRTGYAERMYEQSDIKRKETKENGIR